MLRKASISASGPVFATYRGRQSRDALRSSSMIRCAAADDDFEDVLRVVVQDLGAGLLVVVAQIEQGTLARIERVLKIERVDAIQPRRHTNQDPSR